MQLRAARRLLQWPQAEVAKANGWKVHVINEVETGARHRPQAAETLKKFYESVGIIFHADGRVQVDASEE
jgi:transcriptional regulator with XRE-family HTH domain